MTVALRASEKLRGQYKGDRDYGSDTEEAFIGTADEAEAEPGSGGRGTDGGREAAAEWVGTDLAAAVDTVNGFDALEVVGRQCSKCLGFTGLRRRRTKTKTCQCSKDWCTVGLA